MSAPPHPPLLRVDGVSRSFGPVHALRAVSFDVAPGEVHALVGENGAGKSTLIRVLAGVLRPGAGAIILDGRRVEPGSVRAAEHAGIAVVHQHPVLFPDLAVADNIHLAHEPRRRAPASFLLDRRAMHNGAARLLAELSEPIDPGARVRDLPLARRQIVAVARALARDCRLLVLDEPTASLSVREADALLRVVAALRARGVGVLYVSHRLDEVFRAADRVTVLRDGRLVATRDAGSLSRDALVALMLGRDAPGPPVTGSAGAPRAAPVHAADLSPAAHPPPAHPVTPARGCAPLLSVVGLSRPPHFADVSFDVAPGEILALAGLVGAGRSELARCIAGVDRPRVGVVRLAGRAVAPGSVRAALAAGIALVPEDRHREGLILPFSVRANLSLGVLPSLCRAGFIRRAAERRLADRWWSRLSIRGPGHGAPASALSGGNQQKVLLARWLAADPRVLILDEPTRGVDVGAKDEIHAIIRELASRGVGILLISSDLPELLALGDRVLVLRDGRAVASLPRADADPARVLSLMMPDAAAPPAEPAA